MRKPTVVLDTSGAFKKDPARRRPNEPDSGKGIGPAPKYLADAERAIWDEIVSDCAPGVFQSGDRLMLEALVSLVALMRTDPKGFGSRRLAELRAYLTHCGMTPSARSKVSVPPRSDGKAKSGLASFR